MKWLAEMWGLRNVTQDRYHHDQTRYRVHSGPKTKWYHQQDAETINNSHDPEIDSWQNWLATTSSSWLSDEVWLCIPGWIPRNEPWCDSRCKLTPHPILLMNITHIAFLSAPAEQTRSSIHNLQWFNIPKFIAHLNILHSKLSIFIKSKQCGIHWQLNPIFQPKNCHPDTRLHKNLHNTNDLSKVDILRLQVWQATQS